MDASYELDRDGARAVIVYLEDRRVLFTREMTARTQLRPSSEKVPLGWNARRSVRTRMPKTGPAGTGGGRSGR